MKFLGCKIQVLSVFFFHFSDTYETNFEQHTKKSSKVISGLCFWLLSFLFVKINFYFRVWNIFFQLNTDFYYKKENTSNYKAKVIQSCTEKYDNFRLFWKTTAKSSSYTVKTFLRNRNVFCTLILTNELWKPVKRTPSWRKKS